MEVQLGGHMRTCLELAQTSSHFLGTVLIMIHPRKLFPMPRAVQDLFFWTGNDSEMSNDCSSSSTAGGMAATGGWQWLAEGRTATAGGMVADAATA